MWNYNKAIIMIKNFLNFYNIDPKEVKIKELIDAYYMELQRIENEEEKKEQYNNYYNEFNMKAKENEIYTINGEEIYEDLFLNTFIPLIIKRKLVSINENTNWQHDPVSFRIDKGEDNSINEDVFIISEKYYDIVIKYIESFASDYELTISEDKTISTSSLKKLVDAYYMELQRLEYIKEDTYKR